jgi:hypothetical protein
MSTDLDRLILDLEEAAARLRGGEMDAEEAAALVERCAELAGRLGTELDRTARAAASEGQEQLL